MMAPRSNGNGPSGPAANTSPLTIKIEPDSSFEALIRLFEDLAQVPLELRERLLDFFDKTSDRFRIEVNNGPTPSTVFLRIRLAPEFGEGLREFATAVRARDFDLFFVEQSDLSIDGCVGTPKTDERGPAVNVGPHAERGRS